MASIPSHQLAREVLDACLRDGTWPTRTLDDLIERALDEEDMLVARNATRALFSVVIEQLGDLFEPQLCDVYAQLFAHVISHALPEYKAEDLLVRYRAIRQIKRFGGGETRRVYVLSRVTLGADVAVTSVVLDAAKKRFPEAEICMVGPAKNAEMFAGDKDITPIPMPYGRSSLLRERLEAAFELKTMLDGAGAIIIDPDSRLTQLGLIPLGDDDARYFFFESRAFGGALDASLSRLTAEWIREVFDVEDAVPYVAPLPEKKIADVAVSWGVGDNASKRIEGDFEFLVLSRLLQRGRSVILDSGAGGEEAERVNGLRERLACPELLHVHEGAYASFASHIAQSRLYVGYDSAGQHVAAAAGVPLVSVFKGYACERMLSRWKPDTPSSQVVVIEADDPERALRRTLSAIEAAEGEARLAVPMG